jgi:PPOX class probable F420-dependent enzyme
MIPSEYEDLLTSTAVAVVATVDPSGRPQNNPVWFHWDGTRLRFGTMLDRQKFRNLQRDPSVAVCIVDPRDSARYLEIRGRVARIEDDTAGGFGRIVLRKYTGQDDAPWLQPDANRVAVVVQPERCTFMDGRAAVEASV